MSTIDGYLGTYQSSEKSGIYHFTLDNSTGELSKADFLWPAANAKCISVRGEMMAFSLEAQGKAGICLMDLSQADPSPFYIWGETVASSYLAFHNHHLYTANYHEGTVRKYKVKDSALFLKGREVVGPGAGCHQVLPYGQFVLVPCLKRDQILILDAETLVPVGHIDFPKGSGPRHSVMDKRCEQLYVVGELSNQLFRYTVMEELDFRLTDERSVLPPGVHTGQSAAIRLSSGGRFLYTTTRGADLITVFDVSGPEMIAIQFVNCGGRGPKDFVLDPSEKFLLVVNRESDEVVCFPVDSHTGLVGESCSVLSVPQGSSLILSQFENKPTVLQNLHEASTVIARMEEGRDV